MNQLTNQLTKQHFNNVFIEMVVQSGELNG